MADIQYFIDGVNLKDYSVYVSKVEGIFDRPKLKQLNSASWDNEHGKSVNLKHKFYEHREIILSCFMKAESKDLFQRRIRTFSDLFSKPGYNRLRIDAVPGKPLLYETYNDGDIAISKEWSNRTMIGIFKLQLIEPEPVKRVLFYSGTGQISITLTSEKLLNIFWGDGTVDYDIYGKNKTILHNYTSAGIKYILIYGDIDSISSFSHTGVSVFEKI